LSKASVYLVALGLPLLLLGSPFGWMVLLNLPRLFQNCEPWGPVNCWDASFDPNNAGYVPPFFFILELILVVAGIASLAASAALYFRQASRRQAI